jgi:hypothetical protein
MNTLKFAETMAATQLLSSPIRLISFMTAALVMNISALAQESPYADPAEPALPQTVMTTTLSNTALVITDPQIDFLSPDGVT